LRVEGYKVVKFVSVVSHIKVIKVSLFAFAWVVRVRVRVKVRVEGYRVG
jgi:hypothetical protein